MTDRPPSKSAFEPESAAPSDVPDITQKRARVSVRFAGKPPGPASGPAAPPEEPPPSTDPDDFARLSPSGRAAFGAAMGLAEGSGATEVHMEHLLAGLFATSSGPVRTAVQAADLDGPAYLEALARGAGVTLPDPEPYKDRIATRLPGLSAHVQQALRAAIDLAASNEPGAVQARHLFAGAMQIRVCRPVTELLNARVDGARALAGSPDPADSPGGLVVSAQTDLPTRVDRLGYRPIVDALRTLLTGDKTTFPLTIGISAPWGGGKSSVMEQLQEDLRSIEAKPRWVIVVFPAWRYETGEQLWAAMAKATYDAAVRSRGNRVRRLWFRLRLEASRLSVGKRVMRGILAVVPGALIGYASTQINLLGLGDTGEAAIGGGAGTAIGALAQAAWVNLADPFKRTIESMAANPPIPSGDGFNIAASQQVNSLMKILLRDGGRMAVFIDDLDRCSPTNVVRVIEAVNQIFVSGAEAATRSEEEKEEGRIRAWIRRRRGTELKKNVSRLVFVAGMDRQVVARGIEVRFAALKRRLDQEKDPAGQAYGLSFLDKIVQLWVVLPTPSEEKLLEMLASVAGEDGHVTRATPSTGTADGNGRTERPVEATNGKPPEEKPSEEDSDAVKEAMKEGIRCLDRNPRQVKRFNNAFRLQLALAQSSEPLSDDQLKLLARWVALRLRWGALASAMDEHAGLLEALELVAMNTTRSLRGADGTLVRRQKRRVPRWFDTNQFADLEELKVVLKAGTGRISELRDRPFLRIA